MSAHGSIRGGGGGMQEQKILWRGGKKKVGSQGEMLREKEREGERDGVNNKWESGGMQWIFFFQAKPVSSGASAAIQ